MQTDRSRRSYTYLPATLLKCLARDGGLGETEAAKLAGSRRKLRAASRCREGPVAEDRHAPPQKGRHL